MNRRRFRIQLASMLGLGLLGVMASSCGSGGATEGRENSSQTPFTPAPAIATQFSNARPFLTANEGQALVGFPLLRPDPFQIPVSSAKGLIETFPEIGLPRARQTIVIEGQSSSFEFTQEPMEYPRPILTNSTKVTIGSFEGDLWQKDDQISFIFETGAVLGGSKIIGVLTVSEYPYDEFVRLVESLTFGR